MPLKDVHTWNFMGVTGKEVKLVMTKMKWPMIGSERHRETGAITYSVSFLSGDNDSVVLENLTKENLQQIKDILSVVLESD